MTDTIDAASRRATVTTNEAARLLGIGPAAVRARLNRKTLDGVQDADGIWHVYADQLAGLAPSETGRERRQGAERVANLESSLAAARAQLAEAEAARVRAERDAERERERADMANERAAKALADTVRLAERAQDIAERLAELQAEAQAMRQRERIEHAGERLRLTAEAEAAREAAKTPRGRLALPWRR